MRPPSLRTRSSSKMNVKTPIMRTAKWGEWYLSLTEATFSGRILSKAIAKSIRLNVMKYESATRKNPRETFKLIRKPSHEGVARDTSKFTVGCTGKELSAPVLKR